MAFKATVCAMAILVAMASTAGVAKAQDCSGLAPQNHPELTRAKVLTPSDLVALRDIGPVDPTNVRSKILSVSPDATKVAFQIRRGDPVVNGYCFSMFVLSLEPSGKLVKVDEGGEYIPIVRSSAGFAAFTSPGPALTITPKWSPDGDWIAYQRRDGGVTGLWRARADGSHAEAVVNVDFDVEDFAWRKDGQGLVFSGRPKLIEARNSIKQEAKQGYLYDARFVPTNSNSPLAREPVPTEIFGVDLVSRAVKPATKAEQGDLRPPVSPDRPSTATLFKKGNAETAAWLASSQPAGPQSKTTLYVRFDSKRVTVREVLPGTNISGLFWSSDGTTLYFLSSEGWGFGWDSAEQALYRWKRGERTPLKVFSTEDVLIGCEMARDRLICGHEAARQPRELVEVALDTGEFKRLFDPNPEFGRLSLGMNQRLLWKNNLGGEAFGDLVLPPDHRAGQKHPMIVVQYRSRGFLRGGTGDAYPIQLFANNGFAVLSVNHPSPLAFFPNAATWKASEKESNTNLAGRKAMHSSLMAGVAAAVATGVVDSERIGLTGLSDGTTTAQFALVNSNLFKAAAVSGGFDERSVTGFLVGPVIGASFRQVGYPNLTDTDAGFWANYSLRTNDAKLNAPLLIHAPDVEYLGALETHAALQEQRKPVEMYVYPDEFHNLWQPSHRQASFIRSLDWFKFWLMDTEDPDPAKAEQFARWREMRSTQPKPN